MSQKGQKATSGGKGPSTFKKEIAAQAHFVDFVTEDEALAGIVSGIYLQGKLRVNPKSRKNAYVSCKGVSRDILVQDEVVDRMTGQSKPTGHRNRAFHGDIVVIQVLPEEQWPLLNLRASISADTESATVEDFCPADMLARLRLTSTETDPDASLAEEDRRRKENRERLWRPNDSIVKEFNRDVDTKAIHWIDAAAKRDAAAPRQPIARVVRIMRPLHLKTLVGALEIKDAMKI